MLQLLGMQTQACARNQMTKGSHCMHSEMEHA